MQAVKNNLYSLYNTLTHVFLCKIFVLNTSISIKWSGCSFVAKK